MTERTLPPRTEQPDFSRSFFGFDPLEVRRHIEKLNDRLARSHEPGDFGPSMNGASGDHKVTAAIDLTVNEIAEVLEAARVAARKMRERAEREASEGNVEAARQARRILEAAEADAYAVRKSAWDTSTELLESAKVEGARLRSAVERDALDIIGEAERRAHRKLAGARRDSDSLMQSATAKSDRLLGLARARATEIVRTAEERAGAIFDQTPVADTSQEDRLEQDGDSDGAVTEPSTVRVVYPGSSAEEPSDSNGDRRTKRRRGKKSEPAPVRTEGSEGWADGTRSVRLVTPSSRPDLTVEDLAGRTAMAAGPDHEDRVEDVDLVGDSEVADRGQGPDANGDRRLLASGLPGSVNRIGSAVRSRAWTGIPDGAPSGESGVSLTELRGREITRAATGKAAPDSLSAWQALRDRSLRPIVNRAVRGVKRQLTDLQGEQVKALDQDREGWKPRRADFGPYLVHTISLMEREGSDCGFSTASEFSDTGLPPPSREEGGSFIDDLFEGVSQAIRASRELEPSGRNVSRDLARVFRIWRTEEVERRLRFLAARAYHRGLVQGFGSARLGKLVVKGGNCCDACNSFRGSIMAPDDAPPIPVHEGCRCMLLPEAGTLHP